MLLSGTPYGQIALVLAACAAANWAVFDRTTQGLLLAALCGLAAPASELLLMKVFHVWHYAKPGGASNCSALGHQTPGFGATADLRAACVSAGVTGNHLVHWDTQQADQLLLCRCHCGGRGLAGLGQPVLLLLHALAGQCCPLHLEAQQGRVAAHMHCRNFIVKLTGLCKCDCEIRRQSDAYHWTKSGLPGQHG